MKITNKFTLKLPLIQAPLTGYPGQAKFVSAISEQGALGVYSTELQTLEAIKKDITAIQQATTHPFAVLIDFFESDTEIDLADRSSANVYLNTAYKALNIKPTETKPFPDVNSVCKSVVALKPSVLIFQNGIPTDAFIEHCHKTGIITLGIASNILEAIAIEESSIDGIILQGMESAGTQSTFENDLDTERFPINTLIHHAKKHVQKPIIIWGDYQNPSSVITQLNNGIKAVVLDVPLWTTEESPIPDAYREHLNIHNEMLTTLSSIWHGLPAQVIKNKLTEFETQYNSKILVSGKQKRLLAPIITAAIKQNNVDYMPLWAGLCAEPSNKPLAEVFNEYTKELNKI